MGLRDQSQAPRTRYFVGIGVGSYDDPSLNLPRAEADVHDVREWFVSRSKVMHEVALEELANSPTVEQIRRGLAQFFRKCTPDDIVVVYVACHGELERAGVHLFGRDTPRNDLAGLSVEPETIGKIIGGSRVHDVLIIIDACVAGPICRALQRAAEDAAEDGNTRDPYRPHMQVVIASTFGRDPAQDGAFARALLKVLSEERWTGTAEDAIAIDQIVRGVNEELRDIFGPQVADRRVWGPGVVALVPNPNYRARTLGALVAQRDLEEHFDPRARGVRTLREDGDFFRGRVAELRRVVSWLDSKDEADRLLVITGQPGSGKSALVARVAASSDATLRTRLAAPDATAEGTVAREGALDGVIWCRHKTGAQIASEIAGRLGGAATGVDALLRLAETREVTLALDALDEADAPERVADEILRPLVERTRTRLLVATRRRAVHRSDERDLLTALGAADETTIDIDASPSRTSDMRAYIEARLRARSVPEAAIPSLAERIVEASDASFLVAAITAQYAQPGDDAVLPREAGQALAEYIARLPDPERVRDVLRPLAWAQGAGLPWAPLWPEAATALTRRRRADAAAIGDEDVRLALDHAGDLIIETVDGSRPVYRLFHEALAENLRADLATDVAQGALADVLWARRDGRPWRDVDSYVRAHLPTHLAAAKRFDALIEVLADPRWERARREETGDPLVAVGTAEAAIAALCAHDPIDERALVLCTVYSAMSAVAPPDIIEVLAEAGQLARAGAMAQNLTTASDRILAFAALARAHGQRGDRVAAARCLEECKRAIGAMPEPHRAMAHAWIAESAHAAGDVVSAKAHAEEAARVAEAPSDDWNVPNGVFWAGLAARTIGDAALRDRLSRLYDSRIHGTPHEWRNQGLQAAAVLGRSDVLAEMSARYHAGGASIRPGNIALALADAGMTAELDALIAYVISNDLSLGEPDARKRWAWALASSGRPDALVFASSIRNAGEGDKALARLADVLAARSDPTSAKALAEVIEQRLQAPRLDARSRARLIRALFRAGAHERAIELAEELIASAPHLGEASDLASMEHSTRRSARASKPVPKLARRAMASSWAMVEETTAAAEAIARATRGDLAGAREVLTELQIPLLRARALAEIARRELDAGVASRTWSTAMLSARAAGRGVVEEVLDAGVELLERAGVNVLSVRGRIAEAEASWAIERFAERYVAMRRARAPGPQRTAQLTWLTIGARRLASQLPATRDDVRAMWGSGDDGRRLFSLLLMQSTPSLAVPDVLIEAIRNPKSAFEQYHSLLAANRAPLSAEDAVSVRAAVESQLREEPRPDGLVSIARDPDRARLARELLAMRS